MATVDIKEYSWSEVEIVMFGRALRGFTGFKYKTAREKEALYARGKDPHSIQRGNKSYEGDITLLQSTLHQLDELAKENGYDDLTDLPAFPISVSYIPEAGGTIITDVIQGAEFTDSEKGMAQGDKKMEVTLPWIALGIKKNV